jgi:anti-sigma regulatory factor (Ser/Thr protein kinase)
MDFNSPNKTSISYKFDIEKNDFSQAGQASSTIKKLLRQLGIDPTIIRSAAIATYEAEINIVIHSEGGQITVNIYPNFIEIVALDRGPGIENIELAMQEGYSTASNEIREMGFGAGMGLSNMKKCSDSFDIKTKLGCYTKVTMILNI